jgi:hypothetical protein
MVSFHYFRILPILSSFCCTALEATPLLNGVYCSDPTHLEAGAEHIRNKYGGKIKCIHCHRCAFCRPVYDMCWSGEHLPPKHWDKVMDELINDTKVMEVLILKVPKASLNKKRKIKMREAFRQNFCVGVPKSMAVDIIPPKAKRQRQCTKDLARDAYIEKTSTDSFSEEDRTRLLIFNKLSSLPTQQKLQDPLSMSDARFPKNVYVRKQVR